MSALDDLAERWASEADGLAGHAYGEALEAAGDLDRAEEVYRALVADGYLIGYADLAWLVRGRGDLDEAERLLSEYLRLDGDPDETTALVSGLLGHWRWDRSGDIEVEDLLRSGVDALPEARVDLALLLLATGRRDEAESMLRIGVGNSEVACFVPLGNLLSESGRSAEAELVYRGGFALGDAHAAYNLSVDLARAGRATEASEWLKRAADAGDLKAGSWLELHPD